MRRPRVFVAVAVVIVLSGCRAEQRSMDAAAPTTAGAKLSPAGLEIADLQVHTRSAVHDFKVELAVSDAEQARGLMFRERLGPQEGMLFPFRRPRNAGFWMRNTLIPLDMIFVRADGTIARIAANTTPRSLESVESGEPVIAVLEIAGGRSAELGITTDDRVSWPGGPSS